MLQIRSIVLRGQGVEDAIVAYGKGANIVAGDSDTGKSYLLHCLDYIFGAEEMRKRIQEAEPYSQLFVEFENSNAETLTLERSLGGGNLLAYQSKLKDIGEEDGKPVAAQRSGKSLVEDVTSVLFAFAGINEAMLRKNDRGEVNRLTIRTILPLFLVDEVLVIEERSPVLGKVGYDKTARKRAFAYMLSGKDDAGIIASEKKEIVTARLNAQLNLISDLLAPIELRLQRRDPNHADDTIEKVDEAIASLSKLLSDHSEERTRLEQEREEATTALRRAESQMIAAEELLKQYSLLNDRYTSDLNRLDFIAEGAHYFDGLQEVRCPLCDQVISPEHVHIAADRSVAVYEAARSEAAKILAHRNDLAEAALALTTLRAARDEERMGARQTIGRVDTRIKKMLTPAIEEGGERLDQLVTRRVDLETARSDELQASDLRKLKERIESSSGSEKPQSKSWEPLPASALRKLCKEIEGVLEEWHWIGDGRVEFDEEEYDIKVDGQPRQSHGKGVRAVLYSAFVIGLLRYCYANGRPHPGVVVIDSPLTSYKKGASGKVGDGPVAPGIEAAFWQSLRNTKMDTQVIIIENKEPPIDVAESVHYHWFAGRDATTGQRVGFIPPRF